MLRILGALGFAVLSIVPTSFSQTTTTASGSDPQAVTLAAKAFATLTGSVAIADVSMTGTATRPDGDGVQTENIALKAKTTGESRVDRSGSDGNHSDVRNSVAGPAGFWVGPDAVNHPMVGHNCLTDAAWFFPTFSILSQARAPNVVATYVGLEKPDAGSVYHLHFVAPILGTPATASAFVSSLTAEDVYLDASSLLPVMIRFNAHPDDDAAVDIPVEVDFSNYQSVNGALVPFKVQELLNNTPFLDITIESVALNTGLSDSIFTD